MSDMDLNKLKVVELKAELQQRGLDTKGLKPVLIERLKEAIEKETQQGQRELFFRFSIFTLL
jgi:SAP domain